MLRNIRCASMRASLVARQTQLYGGQLAAFSVARVQLSGASRDKPDGQEGPNNFSQDSTENSVKKSAPGDKASSAAKASAEKKAESVRSKPSARTLKEPISESKETGRASQALHSASAARNLDAPPASNSDSRNTKGPGSEKADNIGEAYLSKSERLLAIELPHRPAFPGMAMHIYSEDPHLIHTIAILGRLRERGEWDGRVVAVQSRNQHNTAHLVTNIDEVHEIGTLCRLRTFRMVQDASTPTGRRGVHAVLFPIFRVRVGELVQTVKGGSSIGVRPMPAPRGSDAALPQNDKPAEPASQQAPSRSAVTLPSEPTIDGVNIQWMKGVTSVPNEPYAHDDPDIKRNCDTLIDLLNNYATFNGDVKLDIERFSQLVPSAPGATFPRPGFLADFAASLLTPNLKLQQILETTNVNERLLLVTEEMRNELGMQKINSFLKGNEVGNLRSREHILREYLRIIQKQLEGFGQKKETPAAKLRARVENLKMSPAALKVFEEEMERFESSDPSMPDYQNIRIYLDWLTKIPWGIYTKDEFVMSRARNILESRHYGLDEVKNRILEFLAVAKLTGTVHGKIICLSGPPGVGKTSIGKAIAETLGRKFERISVGGVHDISELKGHRRTYVASLPGRIICALKKAECMNPVILIDEIDKIGPRGQHGDASAALLEILDPEQNNSFVDTFIDVPVDLSRVLFICTANELKTISSPLKDRMEIIDIPGYLPTEKVEIANSYLVPKAKEKSGLKTTEINLSRETLATLVNKYTREAGVRGLNKMIEKIYRKVAYRFLSDEESKFANSQEALDIVESETIAAAASDDIDTASPPSSKTATGTSKTATATTESKENKDSKEAGIDKSEEQTKALLAKVGDYKLDIVPDTLSSFVGPPLFSEDRIHELLSPGVAMGLAYTTCGGSPLFIETVLSEPLSRNSKAVLHQTGQLGSIMLESTTIAHSCARMFMASKFPRNHFLEHASLHMHFPEGAVKKDGPSAGIAMVTSIVSLAMNVPAQSYTAMTGEVTLTGKVLQIGGLREKTLAAKTIGIKRIIFPQANLADWEELPKGLREGLEPRPVRNFEDVFNIVFSDVDAAKVNSAWPILNETADKPAEKPAAALGI